MAFSRKRTEKNPCSGSETRKRGPIIGFRATEDERAQIEAAADRAGLTVGSYVRSRALSKPETRAVRRAPVQTAQLAQLLGMLGAVGGAIQRIEQRPAAYSQATNMETVLTEFRRTAAAMMRALGKRPPSFVHCRDH